MIRKMSLAFSRYYLRYVSNIFLMFPHPNFQFNCEEESNDKTFSQEQIVN